MKHQLALGLASLVKLLSVALKQVMFIKEDLVHVQND